MGFAVMTSEVISLRHDVAAERRATDVRAAANAVEIALLSLQTGSRGYILTGDERFLRRWQQGRDGLGPALRDLTRFALSSDESAVAERIAVSGERYLTEWSLPLVSQARRDKQAAVRLLRTREGERRLNGVIGLLTALKETADRVSAVRARETRSEMEAAIAAGAVGVFASLALVLSWAFYVDRLVLRPVQLVSAAANRLGRGELSARVPVQGRGEVAELGSAFNRMAGELEREIALRGAVFDAAVDGICVTDLDGSILFSNARMDAFVDDLGIVRSGTVFERLAPLAGELTTPDAFRAMLARIVEQPQEATNDEFTLIEGERTFRGFTGPVRDSTGAVTARVFTLRETTAERESERLKDEFVANVSHELRTPLTSIAGYLELVLDDPSLPEAHRSHLAVAERNTDRLQHLVDDLLFVTTVEAGVFRLELEPVDLGALASRSVEAFVPLAARQGVDLELDLSPVPPIGADPLRLTQLLENLLSNALKFTPSGGRVTVAVREVGRVLELSVSDTGVGIAGQESERLFGRFARGAGAQQDAVPGVGLGLAIVRAIARAHGGEVEITSEAGAGTTVTGRFPLQAACRAVA